MSNNHGIDPYYLIFYFNETAPSDLYTLSLHDALPISSDVIPIEFRFQHQHAVRVFHHSVIEGRSRKRSEGHTSELQSHSDLVCRLLLEKKKNCGRGDNEAAARDSAG